MEFEIGEEIVVSDSVAKRIRKIGIAFAESLKALPLAQCLEPVRTVVMQPDGSLRIQFTVRSGHCFGVRVEPGDWMRLGSIK